MIQGPFQSAPLAVPLVDLNIFDDLGALAVQYGICKRTKM